MSSNAVVQAFRTRASGSADAQGLRANAPLAVAIGGLACLLGFVLVGPLVSRGAADDAGILSFLFGEGRRAPATRQTAQRVYFAQPRTDAPGWQPRQRLPAIQIARAAHRRVAHRPVVTPRMAARRHKAPVILAVTPPVRPFLLARADGPTLLNDGTLRRGDAVMTAKGVRVFTGARHFPFEVADFRPLAFAGAVAHRNALLAIDRVVRPPAWSASFGPASPMAAIAPGPTL